MLPTAGLRPLSSSWHFARNHLEPCDQSSCACHHPALRMQSSCRHMKKMQAKKKKNILILRSSWLQNGDRMIWPNHKISSYHPVFVDRYALPKGANSAFLGCLMASASWKFVFGVGGASAIGSNRSVAESHRRACARTRSLT